MGIAGRGVIIAKMRKAFAAGQTAASFIAEQREAGVRLYRRTTLLADWRAVADIKEKADRLKYVRKDYYPTKFDMAHAHWHYRKEYNYVMRTKARISPEEPLTERMVQIQSDVPLTPTQMVSQVFDKWSAWEDYRPEILEEVEPFSAIRRTRR